MTVSRNMCTIRTGLLTVLALLAVFAGNACSDSNTAKKTIRIGNLEKLGMEQRSHSFMTSAQPPSTLRDYRDKHIDYPSLSTLLMALKGGQIDVIDTLPYCTVNYLSQRDQVLKPLRTELTMCFVMATGKNNQPLCQGLDSAIRSLQKNGKMAHLVKQWITDLPSDAAPSNPLPMPVFEDAATIRIGVSGDFPPLDYVDASGKPAGFNAALAGEIAAYLKRNIQLIPIEANARMTALSSGKIDAIFWLQQFGGDRIVWNDKEAELLITTPYYADSESAVVKDFPIDILRNFWGLKPDSASEKHE